MVILCLIVWNRLETLILLRNTSQFVPCLINENTKTLFAVGYIFLYVYSPFKIFTPAILYRKRTAVFAPAVCFRQLRVQPSLRRHHELRGAKSASERGVGGEGGGIAAGITELQNPQRDTRTLTERERERSDLTNNITLSLTERQWRE